MKKILLSILFVFFIYFNVSAQEYIAVDIPAMQDMAVGEPVEIDGINGAIVQISTSVASTKSAVKVFYDREMFNLGWQEIAKLTYTREGETLKISFGTLDKDGLSVDFTITSPFE